MKKEHGLWGALGIVIVAIAAYLIFQGASGQDFVKNNSNSSGKVRIVTTLYPYEHLAKEIAGENVEVVNVVKGVEPHDFEPALDDIKMMLDADLVILNGAGLDAWAEKVIPELEKNNVQVIIASDVAELLPFEEMHEEEGHDEHHEEGGHEGEGEEEHHEHGSTDPHLWLSFKNLEKVSARMQEVLVGIDPEHQEHYVKNTEIVKGRLSEWDKQYEAQLQSCKVRTVVTGHEAFAYLAHDYNFKIEGITGISPEQEVTPRRLQEIGNLLRSLGIHTVLVEENTPSQVQEILEKDFQVAVLPFYPLEYQSSAILEAGKGYEDLVSTNLINLARAMECQ